ncbi:MAG: hypothetical protein JNN12_08385 [Bacteroidetes Order II. Incertae sedis bacterium]|nr:hypothetical protein [Bacteroidetes Order II. bacterium]
MKRLRLRENSSGRLAFGLFMSVLVGCFLLPQATAQISPGTPYSTAIQLFSQNWTITEGDASTKISQTVLPIGLYLPFKDRLEMRLSSSYVNFQNQTDNTQTTVSGLSDLKIQAGYALNAERRMVVNTAFSLPTGVSKLTDKQQDVVTDFIAPDLSVRENRLGEGLNAGGTFSFVTDTSEEGLFGGAVGFLYRGSYETALINADRNVALRPGYEASLTMAYSHTTPVSFFQISPTLTLYGDEYIDHVKALRLGPKFQTQVLVTQMFNHRKGLFTAALQGVLRGETMTFEENTEIFHIKNPNSLTALASLDYSVIPKLRLTLTGVGRFIRTPGTQEAAVVTGSGRSNVFEQGATISLSVSKRASISIGQRYIQGDGINAKSEARTIKGFEIFLRTSIRF